MEPVPIQSGAFRPQDRPRHALVLALVRVIAITAFALAGWLALAALTDSASAAEQHSTPASPNTPHASDATTPPTDARPTLAEPTDLSLPTTPPAGAGLPDARLADTPLTDASLDGAGLDGSWLADARLDGAPLGGVPLGSARVDGGAAAFDRVSGRVREIGADPVRFLRDRRDEVLGGKGGAVKQVRDLAAGVPHVRVADVRQEPSIVDGVADVPPGPDAVASVEAHDQSAADDEAHQSGDPAAARNGRSALAQGASAEDEAPGHCVGCHGDQHGPGPVPPPAQDNPRGSGHSFAPVADLRGGRCPVAPSVAGASTFHRGALTDVAAPGGPSVVPD